MQDHPSPETRSPVIWHDADDAGGPFESRGFAQVAPAVDITPPHRPVVDNYAPFTEVETEAKHADKAKGAS